MTISKEGRVIIPVAFVLLVTLAALFFWATLAALTRWAEGWWVGGWWRVAGPVMAFWGAAALVTWGFVVAFFRIPRRSHLTDDGVVFAPCDGTVVVAEDVMEREVTGERRIQVSIFMSITNVHANWYPVGGRVTHFKHHNGRFMVAWHPKSSDDNEHTTTAVSSPHGTVVFRQVAGMVARRIVSYARVGDEAAQNTQCGFIKFGSRVDVYLPSDAEVLVTLGQKVTGSQSPIARLQSQTTARD
ncbi:MAG: phosphatidylserine decarboxylase family protein [Alistipes sp.]|jgi:phosphatidylserine decarboxylase|nr:phosphatidylserine decarboxylase family protein [Alistipes sp.]